MKKINFENITKQFKEIQLNTSVPKIMIMSGSRVMTWGKQVGHFGPIFILTFYPLACITIKILRDFMTLHQCTKNYMILGCRDMAQDKQTHKFRSIFTLLPSNWGH